MTQTVAIYLRISKADARDLADPARAGASTSIEKQRANCRRVAADRYPGRLVVEFVDHGISASKRVL